MTMLVTQHIRTQQLEKDLSFARFEATLLRNGGGNSNSFFSNFHPDPWGFMIQFDLRIFFSNGWLKPPTSLIIPLRFTDCSTVPPHL